MKKNTSIFLNKHIATLSLTLTIALSGCSAVNNSVVVTVPTIPAAQTVTGKVHGGQQPVSGATIQLYAVGITGLKSAATPLIGTAVQSLADGTFNITGKWDCTSNTATYGINPQLYLVATGGNPGLLPATTNNAALAMMAALGPCSSVTASSYIFVDEITTVASVIALAPFMADIGDIGAQGANSIGLVNAFKTANVLANMATGLSPGALPANAAIPVTEINAFADMLATCINSTGLDAGCTGLFSAATLPAGSAPTNTIAAILNITANPSNNVDPLLRLVLPSAPFQPAVAVTPNDWTVALQFTGGGLNAPAGIAFDASGNAWIANAGGNSVTELSFTGTPLTGDAGYTGNNTIFGAQGIAVDNSGNVWVADTLLNSVVKLAVSNGTIQSSASYTSGNLNGPMSLAIDSQNNIWITNFAGGSVTELNSSGASVGSSPLTAGGTLLAPSGIAIDATGNIWVTDNAASDVVEFNQNQALLSGTGYTDGIIFAPEGVALDASGRAWVADNATNSASLFGSTGTPLLTTPPTGGGLSMPAAVAVDGQGAVWIANSQAAGSLSKLAFGQSAPLSPASGFGVLNTPSALAIDASGSIWTANTGDNSISEFIGIAAPAGMPLAAKVGP